MPGQILVSPRPIHVPWVSLGDLMPPESTIVLLTGPSGTSLHPCFVALGYFDEDYRPSRGGPTRWLTISNTALTDYGWVPTHWAPAPGPPP